MAPWIPAFAGMTLSCFARTEDEDDDDDDDVTLQDKPAQIRIVGEIPDMRLDIGAVGLDGFTCAVERCAR